MKACRTCKRLLALTDYYFNNQTQKHNNECKRCSIEQTAKWQRENPAKLHQRYLRAKAKHKDEWSRTKKERFKSDLVYRNKIRLQLLRWRRNHKEQTNATCSRWHKANRDILNAYKARLYIKLKHVPVFMMIKSQRARVHKIFKNINAKKLESTIDILGCSAVHLKDYIASKFKKGMTWDNYGSKGWHVDHIRPLASFDMLDPKQVNVAFHYSNLQPLWWHENLKKGCKT